MTVSINRYGFGTGFSHCVLDGPYDPPRRLPWLIEQSTEISEAKDG